MCTRKGYAASVTQLALATAALYFKLFKLHSRVKISVAQPQTMYSEFPYGNIRQEALDRSGYFEYNIMDNGVWRSLVSRLVRVQEASGSNPDTPTKRRPSDRMAFFFRDYCQFSTCFLEETPISGGRLAFSGSVL